jgi:hypothetical protein
MEPILEQIRATYDCGIWYPVVSSLLMLPDACGAVEFWGCPKKPRDRYIEWYDKWVLPKFTAPNINLDGAVIYIVRNAMVHESTGFTRGKHGFDRILFMPPNNANFYGEFNLMEDCGGLKETAFQITIFGFMQAVEEGVKEWLAEVRGDTDKRREDAISKLVQYRPDGHQPYFFGIPIIS